MDAKKNFKGKKIARSAWTSPTITEWANRALRPLSLLLVTPLVLTRFTEPEIAAWYLFASISFFGQILNRRVLMTFSRMISMARGGAVDLSPIKSGDKKRGGGEPNWEGVYRVAETLGVMRLAVSGISVLAATVIGYFTLGNIVGADGGGVSIFHAFFIMQGFSLLFGFFGHYDAILRGLGHMAVLNRWQVISSVVSIAAGFLTLVLGGGIVALVVAMQLTTSLSLLRNWFLFRVLDDGVLKNAGKRKIDKQTLGWAWQPLWKGFIGQLANLGTIQVSGLILSFYASTGGLASYLFSVSILRSLQDFAMTPFSSQLPRFSRMMASGDMETLKKETQGRLLLCLGIFATAAAVIGMIAPPALKFIGSRADFLDFDYWVWITLIFLVTRFNVYSLSVCAVGNHMILYWRQAFIGLLSVLLMFVLIPAFGLQGLLVSLGLPQLLLFHVEPALNASRQLECSLWSWFRGSFGPVLLFQILLVVGSAFV